TLGSWVTRSAAVAAAARHSPRPSANSRPARRSPPLPSRARAMAHTVRPRPAPGRCDHGGVSARRPGVRAARRCGGAPAGSSRPPPPETPVGSGDPGVLEELCGQVLRVLFVDAELLVQLLQLVGGQRLV